MAYTMTINEAAEISGVDVSDIYLSIKSGRLRARQLGHHVRILPDDLMEFLNNLDLFIPRYKSWKPFSV